MENKEVLNTNNVITIGKRKKIIMLIVKLVVTGIFAAIAILGGSVVGDLIIGRLDTFDPTKYDAASYKETTTNIQMWRNQNINSLSPTQIFVVAENKMLDCEYYAIYTKGYNGGEKGVVTTFGGMQQDLYGYRYRKNGMGYFDYFSTGLKNVAKKVEFVFGDNRYFCYEGTVNGSDTIWKLNLTANGTEYRNAVEYEEMVGCNAENAIDYIVSTKTVLTEKKNEKVGELYSFTLTLNPSTAVLNYVKKMNYMSGFGYPKFSSVELRFEVDEDMNFQNIYINESYKVIGMDAKSKYKMEFTYENVEER